MIRFRLHRHGRPSSILQNLFLDPVEALCHIGVAIIRASNPQSKYEYSTLYGPNHDGVSNLCVEIQRYRWYVLLEMIFHANGNLAAVFLPVENPSPWIELIARTITGGRSEPAGIHPHLVEWIEIYCKFLTTNRQCDAAKAFRL